MTRRIEWRRLSNLQAGDVLASTAPLGSYSVPTARHEAYLLERTESGTFATVVEVSSPWPWDRHITWKLRTDGVTQTDGYREDVVFPVVISEHETDSTNSPNGETIEFNPETQEV